MSDPHPSPPLPTPTAQTATNQAISSALNAPDGFVDDNSPLPPCSLFARPSSLRTEDIFDGIDDESLDGDAAADAANADAAVDDAANDEACDVLSTVDAAADDDAAGDDATVRHRFQRVQEQRQC